jgi:hypothetical protein
LIKASTLIETLVAMVIIIVVISLAALAFAKINRASNHELIFEARTAVQFELSGATIGETNGDLDEGLFRLVTTVQQLNDELDLVEIQAITPSDLVLAKRTKIIKHVE